MTPKNLPGAANLEDLVDQVDVSRHVLANLVQPTSKSQIERILRGYKASGMRATLPSKRWHIDVADVDATLDALLEDGLATIVKGDSFGELAQKARDLKGTIDHPVEDGSDRLDGWVATMEQRGEDPHDTYYAMTHDGYAALTGFRQGEPVVWPDEPTPDPADIQPVTIGD